MKATKSRAAQLKYRYGIDLGQYEQLLIKQGGKCSGCSNGETRIRLGKVMSLSVDHCHATGKVRGLLCDDCNSILGRAKDTPALLRRLASYLEVADTGFGRRVNAKKEFEILEEGMQSWPVE